MRNSTVILLAISGTLAIGYFGFQAYYYRELNVVKRELSSIDGVKVISMWGNEDVTLEEISARLLIHDSIEMIIWGMKPGFRFEQPEYIVLPKLNTYTFKHMSCATYSNCKGSVGIGSSLSFASTSILGYPLDPPISDVRDLIHRSCDVLALLDTLPHYPQWISYGDQWGREHFTAIVENDTSKYHGVWDALMKTDSYDYLKANLPWQDTCCKH